MPTHHIIAGLKAGAAAEVKRHELLRALIQLRNKAEAVRIVSAQPPRLPSAYDLNIEMQLARDAADRAIAALRRA